MVFVGNDLEVLLDREARGEEELEPVSGADDAVCADREALRAERHGSSAFAAPSTTLPAIPGCSCRRSIGVHALKMENRPQVIRELIEIFIRKNETSHKFRKFLAFSEFF